MSVVAVTQSLEMNLANINLEFKSYFLLTLLHIETSKPNLVYNQFESHPSLKITSFSKIFMSKDKYGGLN